MTNSVTFNEEFKALLQQLQSATDETTMDNLVTDFCQLLGSHSLLSNFDFNVGNSYFDGVGQEGELSLEMSNLMTNCYGICVSLKVSGKVGDNPVRAYPRIVHFVDKLGQGSRNYRYIDDLEPETIIMNDFDDDVAAELLEPLCRAATDMVVQFATELLGDSFMRAIREKVAKDIAPHLVLQD